MAEVDLINRPAAGTTQAMKRVDPPTITTLENYKRSIFAQRSSTLSIMGANAIYTTSNA